MQESGTPGSSCSSTKISAVAAPSSRSRRHHSASRAVLPKPAGRARPRQPALRRHGERRQRGALRIARQPLRDRGCPARQPGKRPPARGFAPRTRSLRPARFVQQPCRAEGRAGDRRRTSRRAALVTPWFTRSNRSKCPVATHENATRPVDRPAAVHSNLCVVEECLLNLQKTGNRYT